MWANSDTSLIVFVHRMFPLSPRWICIRVNMRCITYIWLWILTFVHKYSQHTVEPKRKFWNSLSDCSVVLLQSTVYGSCYSCALVYFSLCIRCCYWASIFDTRSVESFFILVVCGLLIELQRRQQSIEQLNKTHFPLPINSIDILALFFLDLNIYDSTAVRIEVK